MKRGLTVIIAAFFLLTGVVGILWYLGDQSLDNQTENFGFKKAEQPDTDEDGLADWEEELWGTNKTEADTDQDGTEDGAEIAAGRNPTKNDDNDKITDPDLRLQTLVRNAQTKQERPLITLPTAEQSPAIVYKLSDLGIESTENVSTIRTYHDNLQNALQTYAAQRSQNELELLLRFVEEGDEGALVNLSLSQTQHLDLSKALLAMSVPESAAELHLNLVNTLAALSETLFYMTKVKEEPVLALESGQSLYQKNYEFLSQLVPLNQYFIERNIND